ncbi:hypothetical protein BDF22DRAFT_654780 [Syncephalis plumigaleata]|nr:hypothetical protein BDF22DRAFT_654780 [Syncephalis plumigaleata]
MTQLNQNDADNDMSMELNSIARARQRRTAGGARGMMGGGGGGGVATPTGSPFTNFNFGANPGAAAQQEEEQQLHIFGANAAPTPASIFGQAPATNTGGFGETTPSKPANTMNTGFAAFGQAAPSTPMVFGSPTTNTTTSGSGFAFANPGVNPFALNKRDNNAIASTNNGNNTKASNADTTKFTFPSTGGFNFGQTTTNTTTTTGGGGGGFTFGSSAATNATDKPFNPFAPKTDASTTTPVKAPAKDTTSGGFSFGIPSSANNNSMATNALGQTEAEIQLYLVLANISERYDNIIKAIYFWCTYDGFTTLASGTSSTLNTGTTTESTADASKQDAEKEKLQEKYYIELRGLNTSFIEHIQSTVSNNPFADLSDSWDAYQKYYQMIDASLKLIQ